ncbi:hypothetical protein ACKWTF_014317 [Chironomus riparius]
MHRNKLLKAAKKTQNIEGFLNRNMSNQKFTNHDSVNEDSFTVGDMEMERAIDMIRKPKIMPTEEIENSIASITNTNDVKQAMSMMLKAYSSLAKAVETNYTNCGNIAQATDDNLQACQEISDELNDEILRISKIHTEYVEENENDKQQLKLKTDIRYFKSQMMIYLKNDAILNNSNPNDCIPMAEKIIKDNGLSLGRAYITKATILSGMKRINTVNKFTKYIYVHFSDSFTSERLIMEMINKNKKSANMKNPDVIFNQPTSYDINKIKRICHELQSDKSVSRVFLGDDSIKVTLNKSNPADINEKTKKIYVRNFSDLDTLRANVSAKSHNIPSRTFYNKNYWEQKYPANGSNQKRKAADSIEIVECSPNDSKKQRCMGNNSRSTKTSNRNSVVDYQNSQSTLNDNNDI